MRRYVAILSVDPLKATTNHVEYSDGECTSKPRSRATISSSNYRLEWSTPIIESYFTHQKSTQQIFRYSPRHWNRGGNFQGAANLKDLGEEQLDECLHSDSQ